MRDERGLIRSCLGLIVGLGLAVLMVSIAALVFSVQVSGNSMSPTLKDGDRVEINLLGRHDIDRFDLVAAKEPVIEGTSSGGADIVKRVIGLPGDRVAVAYGDSPAVFLRPAGSDEVMRVANRAWEGQAGSSSCCTAKGTNLAANGLAKRWATVPDDQYWLIGDNWNGSTDSRVFGFVDESAIAGKLWFVIQPWSRFGRLDEPASLEPAGR